MTSTDVVRDEMRTWVREAASPAEAGESVKMAIRRAARALCMPAGRVKGHWYGEARQVPASEYLTTKLRIDELRRRRLEGMRNELSLLEETYAQDRAELAADCPSLAGLLPPPVIPLPRRKTGAEGEGR